MHICFVESGYPLQGTAGGGGAGTYVQLVARKWAHQGHQVTVVARSHPDCPEKSQDQGVVVYRPQTRSSVHYFVSKLSPSLGRPLSYLERGFWLSRFLKRLHGKSAIDIIEFTEGGTYWNPLKEAVPYVVHLHGSSYTFRAQSKRRVTRAYRLQRRLELRFIRQAAMVISPSVELLRIVEEENGRPFCRTRVMPYPANPSLFKDLATNRQSQTKAGTLTVLFAARNDPVKGGSVLLRSVPEIRKAYPNVVFEFCGYSPSGEEEKTEGVRFFPFLPREELFERCRDADLCVVPSFWDNSPNTVYEAMALGKPVVASQVGGIPELVEAGVTGLLVPPGNPEALAQAILSLLGDNGRREKMGQAGEKRIREIAQLGPNAANRLELYSEVIRSFVGGRRDGRAAK